MCQIVSGINCCPSTAVSEMMAVKKHFGKESGATAYHGYQSFAPGEATPEIAHEIALKLAERLWGNRYQVHKLGVGYSLDEIKGRILQNIYKQVHFPEMEHRPPHQYRLRGKPRKKFTGLQALYFSYCYKLHIIQKRPVSVKRVSFQLREDIAKLERLDRETLFLARSGITSIEQLACHKNIGVSQSRSSSKVSA